jgi:hypothetical protein
MTVYFFDDATTYMYIHEMNAFVFLTINCDFSGCARTLDQLVQGLST